MEYELVGLCEGRENVAKVITLLGVRPRANATVSMAAGSEISTVGRTPTPVSGGGEWLKAPRIARNLDQAEGWLKELGTLYREARRGVLPPAAATRLTYIASVGARMAKDVAELREVESIRKQLEAIGRAAPVGSEPYLDMEQPPCT
jgi:hypothetical protein